MYLLAATSMFLIVFALIAGSTGGFIDAMSGSGFGAISVSIFVFGGAGASTSVIAVNIAKIISGMSSSAAHIRLGNVRWRITFGLASGGVVGAVAGGLLASSLPQVALQIVVHAMLVVMAVLIGVLHVKPEMSMTVEAQGARAFSSTFGQLSEVAAFRRAMPVSSMATLVTIGVVAGFSNSVSGAFGPVVIAGFMLARQVSPRIAVGSVSVAEIIVAAAGVASLVTLVGGSREVLILAAPLAIGGLVMAPAGAAFAGRVSRPTLTATIAAVLFLLNGAALLSLVVD